jgi:hypothetical protein
LEPSTLNHRLFKVHKYTIGETVFYTSRLPGRVSVDGNYQVIRLLPPDGGDFQYRIKSVTEAYERVAKESQLELAS